MIRKETSKKPFPHLKAHNLSSEMLYEHPLYTAPQPGQTQINVLVIGSGTYEQKFIDQCLRPVI